MDPLEIRIGNYFIPVTDDGFELDVRKIKASEIFALYTNPKRGKDIYLNPEWLFRFGFTNDSDSWFYSLSLENNKDTFKIFPLTSGGSYNGMWGIVGMNQLDKKIEFVHQLQNIFYDLKNKELTANLNWNKEMTDDRSKKR